MESRPTNRTLFPLAAGVDATWRGWFAFATLWRKVKEEGLVNG